MLRCWLTPVDVAVTAVVLLVLLLLVYLKLR